jgi:hypothetical protein
MAALSTLTECGLPGITPIPYGLHACHFYRDRDQLMQALIPYFLAGVRHNERCLWVTAPPLPAKDAIWAVHIVGGHLHDALREGALRILDFDQWYAGASGLKGCDVVQFWLDEEERAIAEGYSGLRITGNTSFLHAEDWPTFMDYERTVTSRLYGRRIVALCSYSLEVCTPRQNREVMRLHNCAFHRTDRTWQVLSAGSA